MLHIKKITLNNFGPYYGEQSISLLNSKGLSIIYGDNGSGKSTLLKSIKFCLGLDDEIKNINLDNSLLNSIALDEKKFNFFVKLELKWNDKDYEITRKYSKENLDTDWHDSFTVINNTDNNTTLNDNEANSFIRYIFPKQTLKFFLFDGENTFQEYKELLENNDNNKKSNYLKKDIERILGIDSIENSIIDLQELANDLNNEKNQYTLKNKQNNEINKSIESKENKKSNLEKSIDETREKLNNDIRTSEKISIELSKKSEIGELIQEKNNLSKTIEDKKNLIESEKNEMKKIFLDRSILVLYSGEAIIEIIKNEKQISQEDILKYEKKEKIQNEINELTELQNQEKCKHCFRDITEMDKSHFKQKILDLQQENKILINNNPNDNLKYKNDKKGLELISEIEKHIESNKIIYNQIIEHEKKITNYQMELTKHNNLYHTINDEIRKYKIDTNEEKELLKMKNEFLQLEEEIDYLKNTISHDEEDLKTIKNEINEERKKLVVDANYGDKIDSLNKKIYLIDNTVTTLNNIKKYYSEQIRKDVEKDANSMFDKIKNYVSYKNINILNNYSVILKDSNDKIVRNPSQGENVIIILSLIYAIHKNSIVNGSIFFDAPFSVLSDNNSINVYKNISDLSEQVILLTHNKEYINQIKENGQTKILNEYEIEKDKSESNSQLEIYKSIIKVKENNNVN